MEGDSDKKNIVDNDNLNDIETSNKNTDQELNLKEDNHEINCIQMENITKEIENQENIENLNFEQIKKNHMQMMNNINLNSFDAIPQIPKQISNQNYQYFNNNFVNNPQFSQIQTTAFFPNQINMIPMQVSPSLPFPSNGFFPPPPRAVPQIFNGGNNQNYFFNCNPFAIFMQKRFDNKLKNNEKNKKQEIEEKHYFFSFGNTLLTNTQNKNPEENHGVDLTKMTRFNIKFINPFNGSN